MEEENIFFDYTKQPGKIENNVKIPENEKPKVSIITSYYNSEKYLMQTYNCVVAQTFPYWEWIIVDDGSTSQESIFLLKELENKDNRIHVYHKENEGLAKGRDYAISKAMTEYVFPLDADDLIDKTMLECCYFALQAFPEAVWAYSNTVGFGSMKYLDYRKFDTQTMKTDNQITATALIRKNKIAELGGYSVAKRYINEDWHLWLRMLQRGYYPVHMHFYGLWYRRKETESLLKEINNEKNPNNKLRIEEINREADKITKNVDAIELPDAKINTQYSIDIDNWKCLHKNGENVLIITKALKTDKHVLDIVNKENGKHITILTTKECPYIGRQWYEELAEVFDMTTFLPYNSQIDFINYIIKTRCISKIYLCNEPSLENNLKNQAEVIVENFDEDESQYAKYERRYKFSKTIIGRAIRKLKFRKGT